MQVFGSDGTGTTNKKITDSENTLMPDIDYYNKKIIWKKLIEMNNDWKYPHIDTVIRNGIIDNNFMQNYNAMYAVKNKAEILLNMFNIGDLNIRDLQDVGLIGGAMKNQKVKKCEKKKVVLGKERCIYKVSGSKKDYMKYKGKLVAVSDYVKSMKKKN
jgi:hypothetical protein